LTTTRRLSRALVAALLTAGLAATGTPPAGAAEATYLTFTVSESCVGLRRGETQPVSFTVKNTSDAAVGTTYRRLLSVDLGKVRTGRVTIKTLTTGRVYVDGLGASRV